MLVKFLKTIDAVQILSNRKLLQSPVHVKPHEERKTDSLVLKERILSDKVFKLVIPNYFLTISHTAQFKSPNVATHSQ